MAKIDRYDGNLKAFASEQLGSERTLFGKLTSANDLTSQITAEFLRGWGIVGPSDQPSLQDFNAAMYTNGQLIAYLHQMGIAEYNAAQEYFIGSVTQAGGEIYISLVDGNVGNVPASSPVQWRSALSVPDASTTVKGIVELATSTETQGGTDAAKAVTPAGLASVLSGKQNADATLTALAALTVAANKLIYATGADKFATTDLSEFARTLLDDADAAAARGTLGLGTAATKAAQTSFTDTTAGALMAVGAFGLGGTNAYINNTGLNALSKTGFYMGDSLVNAPLASAGWFYVLHQEHGAAGYSSQIAIDLASSTPKTYQRQKSGGIWQPWYEVWNSSTLPVTAFAKTLLDDANAAAARDTLGAVSSTDVDAKFTGTNVSLAANGYQKLPSGLIIQWGSRAAASGNVSVTFPLAFPTACASVNATRSTGGSDVWPPQIQSISNTGFTYLQTGNSGASMSVYWMAIGY